ncbi:hypothetical protein NOVO_09265 (plasmid) [Rickettsiales bacterium Ac37b]|nr:hypothetical protein NOVO_09265 [Rickettsiales bacterium Ac37b]
MIKLFNKKMWSAQMDRLSINSANKKVLMLGVIVLTTLCFFPDLVLADNNVDGFKVALDRAEGWISGTAGKLITFISILIAGIMGVAGFPAKHVAGAIGVGLLLSSAKSLVDMIF